jgi:hypothetical protein
MVFRDLTPPAQKPTTLTQVTLSGSATGTVSMALSGRSIKVMAYPTGITGTRALLVIPTTVTNETVPCAVDTAGHRAICNETLIGDPMIGATATLSVDGAAVATGIITGM